MHVAELARLADVTPATIRYYARIGLLDPGREPENDYRCFSTPDLKRVGFIRQAQALGLTIGDIKSILEAVENGDIPCHQVRSLVKQRLDSIRDRISELQATEARITRALKVWKQMEDPVPAVGEFCPLIERIDRVNGTSVSVSGKRAGPSRHSRGCNGHGHDSGKATRNAMT